MDNSEVEGLPSRQETDQNVDEGDGVDRRADAIALAEAAVGAGAAVEAGGAGGGAAPVEPLADFHESEVVTVTDRASAASELPDAVNSSAPIGVDAVEGCGDRRIHAPGVHGGKVLLHVLGDHTCASRESRGAHGR